MAGTPYTVDPTSSTSPLDTNDVTQAAEELRTLKAYIQTQLSALSAPALNANWNAKYKNLIINGDAYWNHSIVYEALPDNWQVNTTNAGHIFNTIVAFTPGQTDVPDEPAQYASLSTTNSGAPGDSSAFDFRIEDVRTLAGKVATLTFYAKAGINTNISVELIQNFGTGGTPSSEINASSSSSYVTKEAITTAWQKFVITVAVPSIAGKVIGTSGSYLAFKFWLSAGSNYDGRTSALGLNTATVGISHAQLEEGGISTPFEYRNQATELKLIQRYLWFSDVGSVIGLGMGAAIDSSTIQGIINLPETMRVPPSFDIYGSATIIYCVGSASIAASGVSLGPTGTNSFNITVIVPSAHVGQAYNIMIYGPSTQIVANAML